MEAAEKRRYQAMIWISDQPDKPVTVDAESSGGSEGNAGDAVRQGHGVRPTKRGGCCANALKDDPDLTPRGGSTTIRVDATWAGQCPWMYLETGCLTEPSKGLARNRASRSGGREG